MKEAEFEEVVEQGAQLQGLQLLNLVYPVHGSQTTISSFAEATLAIPVDLASVDLGSYKGLRAPFDNWE
jgi:hypothetical protein